MIAAYRSLSALFTDAQGGSVLAYVVLAAVCFWILVVLDRRDRARRRRLGSMFPPAAHLDDEAIPTRSRPVIRLWPEDDHSRPG